MVLGVVITAIWGFSFVVIRWGLDSFPPLLLAALRFAAAATAIAVLPKPALPWRWLVLVGMIWFTGQFGFLFVGMRIGMPAGLASVLLQSQAILTVLLAAVLLGERVSLPHLAGIAVAVAGLVTIGATVTDAAHDITYAGLACIAAGAASWAFGNILVRRSGQVDMLAFVTWVSLVPPLPLAALSLIYDGQAAWTSLAHPHLAGVLAVLFLGFVATTAGFGGWGHLIKLYGAAAVSPFALLVPVFGASAAWLFLGETFSTVRLAGMALILAGIGIVLWASRRRALALQKAVA